MRLLNVSVDSLVVESSFHNPPTNLTNYGSRVQDRSERHSSQVPPYVILSHRWVGQEVVYPDFELVPKSQLRAPDPTNLAPKTPAGADENNGPGTVASVYKIAGACEMVRSRNPEIRHIWIDTICIDKREPRELSAAMNSMFEWYKNSAVCYVYLFDVTWSPAKDPAGSREQFRTSQWFERGWTLQELLAPKKVCFFDRTWRFIGKKQELADDIMQATGISREHLLEDFRTASTAQKMSWLARRRTTLPEDISYCAQGLFGVFLNANYGFKCEEVFLRLQHEIFKAGAKYGAQFDESLFAWTDHNINESGLFAQTPMCFLHAGDVVFKPGLFKSRRIELTNSEMVNINIPTRMNKRAHRIALQISLVLTCCVATYGLAAYLGGRSLYRRSKTKHLINLNCWRKGPDERFRTVRITVMQIQDGTWRRVECGKLGEGDDDDVYSQSAVHGLKGLATFPNVIS